MSRRVAVLTTSRAEYGLLFWLLRRLKEDPRFRLQLIVSGAHLSADFGRTVRQIETDGLPIAAKVSMVPADDSPAAAARSLARGLGGLTSVLGRLRPDVLVLLGDRLELLAAASAAVCLRLPIAHIHGGEATEGVLDDQVRHAVTKMAHLHFTAAEPYRRRVIQMGEHPSRVFNTGAPGLEALDRLEPLNRAELERELRFSLEGPIAVITYHAVNPRTAAAQAEAVLRAVGAAGLRAVMTYAGADSGGRAVNEALKRHERRHPGQAKAFACLGQRRYLSLLRYAAVVVGNSSSALLEAPSLKIPTINVGDRQNGRLKAPSVIDCGQQRGQVASALKRALSPAFRARNCRGVNPYGSGPVSERILRILAEANLGEALLKKKFHEAR